MTAMVHDTNETLAIRDDLRKWLPVLRATLRISQNEFARRAKIDESVFSRWLRGVITSEPCERKARRALTRLKRRVLVDRERAS